VALVLTLLVMGEQWVVNSSFFRVTNVQVVGATHESDVAVIRASGLLTHPNLINLESAPIIKRLERFAWITRVRLEKHFPHGVTVVVTEATPVGVAATSATSWHYVGDSGRDLGVAPATANLPTLRYLGAASSQWPFQTSAHGAVVVAHELPNAFSRQVSVISENTLGSISIKLTSPVTFVLGPPTNLHNKFIAMASVIAHAHIVPGSIIDVTVPDELAVTTPGAVVTTTTTTIATPPSSTTTTRKPKG
jgi:cell division protein FtsQ